MPNKKTSSYIDDLKRAIRLTVDELGVLDNSYRLKGKVVSGKGGDETGYVYNLSGMTVFETSIVQKLVINIASNFTDEHERIGWEISYPREEWGRAKLDLALDYVENSDYLFRTVIEVKKWQPVEKNVPYTIWDDIFKIIGFSDENNKEVGMNKFILIFFANHENVRNLIDDTFVNLDNLMNMKKNEAIKTKYINRMKNCDIENNYNFFEFFIKYELEWDNGIDFVLGKMDMKSYENVTPKILSIEPIVDNSNVFYIHGDIGAVLLRVNC